MWLFFSFLFVIHEWEWFAFVVVVVRELTIETKMKRSDQLPPEPQEARAKIHELEHPRDSIAQCLRRVYNARLTTTSGGNVSVLNRSTGVMWVTPKGTDKGELPREHVLRRDSTTRGMDSTTTTSFSFAINRNRISCWDLWST